MTIDKRSHTGCWTCRLRKRKCDEKVPVCSECKSLKLDCHGYGEKPTWMDRGAKQKAQAAEVKQIVAAARRGRMKRIQGQVDSTLKRGRESNSTADNDFNAHTATTLAPSRQTVADQETAAPSSPKAGFPYDSKQTPLDYRDDLMVADFISHSTTVWGLHSPLDETVPLFPNSWTFDDELNSPHELHTEVHDVEPELVHNAEITIPQPYALTGKDASVTEDSSMLVIGNVEEAMLLAHYMDKVFSWQFQFSSLHQPDFSQGHIMWFITQSRTLYHATLALSSTHRSLQNNLKGISIDSVRAKRTCWYDLAIQGLQYDLQNIKSSDETCILTCIVMLLHSALLHNTRKVDWPVWLQAGISIVTSWTDPGLDSFRLCHIDGDEQEASIKVKGTAKFFLVASIMRFDMLSSLVRSSAPAYCQGYRQILQTTDHAKLLETVLGCRSWLISTLLDVYALREWKKSNKSAGLLSLWELTSKAHGIEERLERNIQLNLDLMDKARQGSEDGGKHCPTPSQPNVLVITHIFACAVSILLETTVSGSHPQLPEIRRKVDRAVESYAYIDNPDILHVLCWPLCVAGCVAEPEWHGFFRDLLSSPNISQIHMFQQSLELLEKCWKVNAHPHTANEGFNFTSAWKEMCPDLLIA